MTNPDLMTRIDADLKEAMRNRDDVAKLTLRAIKTSLLNQMKSEDGPAAVSDEVVQAAVQLEAKRRRDAITEYEKAGRKDLAEQEGAELAILEKYLPRQLDEAEIRSLAESVIQDIGAESMAQMGQVMSALMPKVAGVADGRLVSQIVRGLLS